MMEFFRALFGTDFMPHLYCLRSDPGVLWLQVLSDLLIAVAYFAIPLVLLQVVLKRKEALFRRVAVLFVLFIAACGTTHLLAIWTIWYPMYRLEGVVKAATAVLSVTTAIVLVRLRPGILQLPGLAELEKEIEERKLVARQLAENVAELRHSNESLEQFAHIASHDLQEPLRMVASYTQLLSKRYKGRLDADADEFIGYAVDGTQRMKRLIEDLLVYSRSNRGLRAAREFCCEEALREALANLKTAIAESQAQVTYDPLPTLTASELQLVQIFQNLIGNAIKYRADRVPQVHVSARRSGEEWIFSVADNGIGIDSKYFDRVFAIFQRLHGRGEYDGTGIGLAICRRILQQQGGRIWVESEPGQGSTFYFALPGRPKRDA